jgi:hypothetical protein
VVLLMLICNSKRAGVAFAAAQAAKRGVPMVVGELQSVAGPSCLGVFDRR